MKPFKDAKEAAQFVENFEGKATNMAVIADKILDKGWELNGYEEKEGYRVFMYKEME